MPKPIPCIADVFDEKCHSRDVLRLIADRWTLLVVALLERGTQRNSDLLRQIGGISPKVLSATLRKLEEHGFVARMVYPEIPPRVEYSLTDLGLSLSEVVVALDHWVESNSHTVKRAKQAFQQRRGSKNPWQIPEVVQQLPRPGRKRAAEARSLRSNGAA